MYRSDRAAMSDRLLELEEGMKTKQEVINKLMRAQEKDKATMGSSSAAAPEEELVTLEQECRTLRGQLRTLLLASPGRFIGIFSIYKRHNLSLICKCFCM